MIYRPQSGAATLTTSDNLIIIHFKDQQTSYSIDLASIPFDAAGNITLPATVRNAVARLAIHSIHDDNEEVKQAVDDPTFQAVKEEVIPYHSYEVNISSASIGLELESTFQQYYI